MFNYDIYLNKRGYYWCINCLHMEKGSATIKPALCSLCGCKYFYEYDPRDVKRKDKKLRRISI